MNIDISTQLVVSSKYKKQEKKIPHEAQGYQCSLKYSHFIKYPHIGSQSTQFESAACASHALSSSFWIRYWLENYSTSIFRAIHTIWPIRNAFLRTLWDSEKSRKGPYAAFCMWYTVCRILYATKDLSVPLKAHYLADFHNFINLSIVN